MQHKAAYRIYAPRARQIYAPRRDIRKPTASAVGKGQEERPSPPGTS